MPNIDPIYSALEQTLKEWKQGNFAESPMRFLHLVRQLCKRDTIPLHQAIKTIVIDAINHIEVQHPYEAELLRRHYLYNEFVQAIAYDKGVAESTAYRSLSQGRKWVAQQIQQLENQARTQLLTDYYKRLEPPTYSHLIGIEHTLEQLTQMLQAEGEPWIVSIEGIGGIGKTALADALARRLLDQSLVYDLAWITARQSLFHPGFHGSQPAKPALTSDALMHALYLQLIGPPPSTLTPKEIVAALTALFKAQPHLIFIDNLETIVDVEALLPTLRGWVDPTRFVLTTRHSLFGHSDIFLFAQAELSKKDSLLLFRHEADTHNLPDVAKASDKELLPVIMRAGGNPLALKLIVGLLHIHSLDEIIADLISRRSGEINRLYDFIYLRAWESLEEVERSTLLAMPLMDEMGGTLDDLAGFSRLNRNDLHQAIERLTRLNLVNRRGGLHQSRYTIHSLTRSFIHRQIVDWEE